MRFTKRRFRAKLVGSLRTLREAAVNEGVTDSKDGLVPPYGHGLSELALSLYGQWVATRDLLVALDSNDFSVPSKIR